MLYMVKHLEEWLAGNDKYYCNSVAEFMVLNYS